MFQKRVRTDHDLVLHADDGERHSRTRVTPCEGSVDIAFSLSLSLRNRAPAVKSRIASRGRNQASYVVVRQRFEADGFALQREVFGTHL